MAKKTDRQTEKERETEREREREREREAWVVGTRENHYCLQSREVHTASFARTRGSVSPLLKAALSRLTNAFIENQRGPRPSGARIEETEQKEKQRERERERERERANERSTHTHRDGIRSNM